MARPKRRKIEFTEESINDLFQEIYNDNHNIKAKLARLFTKWEIKVKEGGEIAAIGDQIVKLLATEIKNQDQKIILLRYLKEIVYENKKVGGVNVGNDGKVEEEGEVTTDRRNELINLVERELEIRDNTDKEN